MIFLRGITAFVLVMIAFVVGSPFAVLGFFFQFSRAAFETGRGFAVLVSQFITETKKLEPKR